ncbi:hypothetical protein ABC974_20555, partial [Sphingomonas oligophenolica]
DIQTDRANLAHGRLLSGAQQHLLGTSIPSGGVHPICFPLFFEKLFFPAVMLDFLGEFRAYYQMLMDDPAVIE